MPPSISAAHTVTWRSRDTITYLVHIEIVTLFTDGGGPTWNRPRSLGRIVVGRHVPLAPGLSCLRTSGSNPVAEGNLVGNWTNDDSIVGLAARNSTRSPSGRQK